MPNRSNQRTAIGEALARVLNYKAWAVWVLSSSTFPSNFLDSDAKQVRGIVANDADPNTTPPDEATRVYSSRCASLGILVQCDQDVVIEVWTKTGLSEVGDPEWVCVKRALTISPATAVLQNVDVGWKESFVRVVSGAEAGHPVNLYVAVC